MNNTQMIRQEINHLITQTRYDVSMLANVSHTPENAQTFQRLWDSLSSIHFLSELLASPLPPQPAFANGATAQHPVTPAPQNEAAPAPEQRTFTVEQLATFDGKNGRPAYVAVNGLVYDVTNNRAWAAATHFGLVSGKDYTNEFASCHAGQQAILATMPVVGRLV
ncbi:cytochrome b5 domain-containing protein [Halobacillus sp. Marseille-Q1614]|uniref:cytochrome b5 domain-containing protein n=1 Tax=Halobacillus sp. Marseille-Q1614 TaxID=2709134 RepID=UPI0015706B43|nr:cytochrome b5 domain-containing protein [Halobacillus sp. Marseille-Q1614]